jgi:hypothetical protein
MGLRIARFLRSNEQSKASHAGRLATVKYNRLACHGSNPSFLFGSVKSPFSLRSSWRFLSFNRIIFLDVRFGHLGL